MTSGEGFLIGRRTLLDADLTPQAYALYYHDPEGVVEADLADARLAASALLDIGIDRLTGSLPAYLQVSHALLTGKVKLPPPPENCGIAVDAAILPITDDNISSLARLHDDGYALLITADTLEQAGPLLGLAEWIRLDWQRLGRVSMERASEAFTAQGVALAAGNLSNHEVFEHCRRLGCQLFDGPFLTEPKIVEQSQLPANRAVALELISRLEDPSCGVADLEQLIIQDATLAWRLLRYVNSASVPVRRELTSVRETILMLGARAVRTLATLVVMARIQSNNPTQQLLTLSLIRARTCELLAGQTGLAEPAAAFSTGLLSLIDALMQRPMPELLDTVPLAANIRLALLDHDGGLGELLVMATSFECGDWAQLHNRGNASAHADTYVSALLWAEENSEALRRLQRD